MAALATALVAACGGGGGNETISQVAKADTPLAASQSTTTALTNMPFAFASGVSSFGTTSTTTVAFTSTSANPGFAISSGGKTATGTTKFGSCIFTIIESTFLPPSPLAAGNTVTVNPCSFNFETQGQAANGVSQTVDVSLSLGTAESADLSTGVSISAGGQITINGQASGTITLAPVTGGS